MTTWEEVLRFVSRFQSPPVVKSSQGRTSAPRERFRPEIPRAIVRARPVETIVRTRACLSVSYILCYILLTLSFFLAPARRLLRPSSFSWPSLSFSSIFSLRCVCFLCLFPSLSMHPSLYVFYSYSFFFFHAVLPVFSLLLPYANPLSASFCISVGNTAFEPVPRTHEISHSCWNSEFITGGWLSLAARTTSRRDAENTASLLRTHCAPGSPPATAPNHRASN